MLTTDLETLAPRQHSYTFNGRDFVQKPLTLRGTTRLVVALSGEMQRIVKMPAFAALMASNTLAGDNAKGSEEPQEESAVDALSMVAPMFEIMSELGDTLPKVICIMLSGKDDPEDVEFVDEFVGLVDATTILRIFIEQNEPAELVANFTVLRKTLSEAIAKAKTETAVAA